MKNKINSRAILLIFALSIYFFLLQQHGLGKIRLIFGPNTKLNQNFLHVDQSSYQKAWEWKYLDMKEWVHQNQKNMTLCIIYNPEKTHLYCRHDMCTHMHRVQEYKCMWTFYKSVHNLT